MSQKRFIGLVSNRTSGITERIEVDFYSLGSLVKDWSLGEKDGPGYVPADIEPGPRNQARVKSISYLVLDIEAKTQTEGGVKKLMGPSPPEPIDFIGSHDIAYHLATTFSHMEPTGDGGNLGPRYRLVFDLSRPLVPAELRPIAQHVAAFLGLADCVDTSCMEPARLFYLRRTYESAPRGFASTNGGQPLNVDALLVEIKAERQAVEQASAEAPSRKDSVIDTSNEQADVGAMLERKGCIPMGANLWLFPGSTSGIPGVKYLPDRGRVYSHHSQDPLHGEHAHDAFSVYAVLEHGGDQKKALVAAAQFLGMQYARDSSPPPRLDPRAPAELHPLARFVPLGGPLRPPKWLIPGFIPEGVVTIAGEPAVGKTTCLLPLALVVAHLCAPENPLRPRHWRHVIFISEDVDQAQRVLKGVAEHGQPRLNAELVKERFHLVEATRLDVDDVVKVGPLYRGEYARCVDGVELLPLVIFDTKSAVLAMQSEDDNAEAAATVAALKQRFEGLPLWVIGHVAKAHKGNSNTRELSMRGAGAWEGDPHLTMFIIREQEQRFIVLGKHRLEESWPELVVQSHLATAQAIDEFGEPCLLPLRWGVATPSGGSRSECRELEKERARLASEVALRDAVCEAVQLAWQLGFPLNKSAVIDKVKRKSAEVRRTIEVLLFERRLIEVDIPSALRTNSKRRSFLVYLTQEEHEAVLRGEPVPNDKLAIPPSMRKRQ